MFSDSPKALDVASAELVAGWEFLAGKLWDISRAWGRPREGRRERFACTFGCVSVEGRQAWDTAGL